jgi:hypothetical protein
VCACQQLERLSAPDNSYGIEGALALWLAGSSLLAPLLVALPVVPIQRQHIVRDAAKGALRVTSRRHDTSRRYHTCILSSVVDRCILEPAAPGQQGIPPRLRAWCAAPQRNLAASLRCARACRRARPIRAVSLQGCACFSLTLLHPPPGQHATCRCCNRSTCSAAESSTPSAGGFGSALARRRTRPMLSCFEARGARRGLRGASGASGASGAASAPLALVSSYLPIANPSALSAGSTQCAPSCLGCRRAAAGGTPGWQWSLDWPMAGA